MLFLRRYAFFLCLLLFPYVSVAAQSLEDLQRELINRNPEILAAKKRYLAAKQLPAQLGALPDPVVSFTNLGVGHPFSGLDQSDFAYVGFGFSQELPFPGKLGLKSDISTKDAAALEQDWKSVALQILSQLKVSYVEYSYYSRAKKIAEENRDLLTEFSRIAEARYRVGQGLQQDVLRSQVEITLAEERIRLLEQKSWNQLFSLNSLLNRNPETPMILLAPISETTVEMPIEELQKRIMESPQFKKKAFAQQRKELELRLAQKERYPDFRAGFQWQKTGAEFPDYYMTTIEARIPLYFWKKQKPAITQATLELKAQESELESEEVKLKTQLSEQYLAISTTSRLLQLYREGILPQTRIGLESTLSAYQVGKVDFLTLLNAAASLLNYQDEYERRLADHEIAIARIEGVTGIPLQPSGIDLETELEHE